STQTRTLHTFPTRRSSDLKDIYLTFDNGYEAGYTTDILDILLEEDVPATFFVTGHYVEQEPKLIKRMVEDGHIIGNHSYHHPDLDRKSTRLNSSHVSISYA